MKKIWIQLFIVFIGIILSIASYKGIKKYYDNNYNNNKIVNVIAYNNMYNKSYALNIKEEDNVEEIKEESLVDSTTTTITTTIVTTTTTSLVVKEDNVVESEMKDYSINDDGSIIFDGMTLTLLTEKLNKHLSSTLTNTGIYFANYTKKTGLDPYLAVAIVLHETGCKWTCSSLVRNNYNIGGLKSGGKFIKYNSLEEGIDGYLNILYNNYYSKGLTTAELMQSKYAPNSTTWTDKINWYINNIKE